MHSNSPLIHKFLFQGDSCKAHFEGQNSEDYPNWGLKTYIIWFSFSNFFIPLVILFYCYTRICYVIWENGKQRKDFSPVKDESTSNNCFKALTRFAQWDILPYFEKKIINLLEAKKSPCQDTGLGNRDRNMCKYFLLFPQKKKLSPEKTETN